MSFQNGVFVLDVFPDGAAGKDGRLQPGDRIVDINKESFKAVESDKAYQTVLRITQGPVSWHLFYQTPCENFLL